MRVAALYDIHGNLPALEAALHACRMAGADAVVLGGDIASGPLPAQTLDILMALGKWAIPVRGNADRAVVACYDLLMERRHGEVEGYHPLDRWAASRITRSHRDYLAELPDHVVLPTDLGTVYFCHAAPGDDEAVITSETDAEKIDELYRSVREKIVACGHTHMQFDRRTLVRRVINPGSVGMPYEGTPGAYWALFGEELDLRRTEYDLRRAGRRIGRSGMPEAQAFTRDYVFASPNRAEALRQFARRG